MNKKITTQQIVTTGLLLALEIIFQIISNYLQFGLVNINISLVAIVMAAVLCGPLSGAVLGFFNGLITLFSPSTLAIFMPLNPVATVIVCLLKCTLAGFIAGLVYNLLKNKNKILGLIIASVLVPIVNTGIFCIFSLIFFTPFLESVMADGNFANIGTALILGVIGINFLIELPTTMVLSTVSGTVLLRRNKE